MASSKKGQTAMAHARAWVLQRYPGALTLEAYPRIAWIPAKQDIARGIGPRRPITIQEDLFGCFDLIVFPHGYQERVQLVQVTTMHADGTDQTGTVATRKKKINTWIKMTWPMFGDWSFAKPGWLGGIYLLGWVPRRHFRVWERQSLDWKEGPPATAPLPRKGSGKAEPSRLPLT
jgi:hypothetical protein